MNQCHCYTMLLLLLSSEPLSFTPIIHHHSINMINHLELAWPRALVKILHYDQSTLIILNHHLEATVPSPMINHHSFITSKIVWSSVKSINILPWSSPKINISPGKLPWSSTKIKQHHPTSPGFHPLPHAKESTPAPPAREHLMVAPWWTWWSRLGSVVTGEWWMYGDEYCVVRLLWVTGINLIGSGYVNGTLDDLVRAAKFVR